MSVQRTETPEGVSQQLLGQRIRNRVIEVLELHASLEYVAEAGAFEAVNVIDDFFPLDGGEGSKVFTVEEKEAISDFEKHAAIAANATTEDIQDIQWFRCSNEWLLLSDCAKSALNTFLKRGRFSEYIEDPSLA